MTGQHIIERLHQGRPVFGTQIVSLMNPIAAKMASEMDLDFAFFCTEHMPLDRTEISMLCQFYLARGISPIVRVPDSDPKAISAALDGGAEGIIVPYVESKSEILDAVGAVKFRPLKGEALDRHLQGQGELPPKLVEFLKQFNQGKYLIIGIESVTAIERLEELIGLHGVDGVFLGPHDITTSMGIPTEYSNPLFIETIIDVIRRCRKQGRGVGLHMPLFRLEPDILHQFLAAGMNLIINGSDVTIMRDAMNQQLRNLRMMASQDELDAAGFPQSSATQSCII